MTIPARFNADVAAWLDHESPGKAPTGLLSIILEQTARPQRVHRWPVRSPGGARPNERRRALGFVFALPLSVAVAVLVVAGFAQRAALPLGSTSPESALAFSKAALDGGPVPDLWLARSDGSDARRIGTGWFNSWSPDGQQLLVDTNSGETILDLDARILATLPRGLATWSPIGDRILVVSNLSVPEAHSIPSIELYRPDGSLIRRLDPPPGVTWFSLPSWSPDGAQFVGIGCQGCNSQDDSVSGPKFDLWIVDADVSAATRLTVSPSESESNPAWSPDGSQIGYWVSCDGAPAQCPDGPTSSWTVSANGGEPTLFASGASQIVWSPDGSRAIYTRTVNGEDRVFERLADGTGEQQLSWAQGNDWLPTWAPGERVAYEHTDSQSEITKVVLSPRDGGPETPELLGEGWSSFDWQPGT